MIPLRKYPYCRAVYLYNKENIEESTVMCLNYEKKFLYNESQDEPDIFDAIKEDLREE